MKSEYDKMIQSEWYDANYDSSLLEMRMHVQDLCYTYNQTRPSDLEKRKELLDEIFDEALQDVEIVAPLWVDYGKHTRFGKYVFINADTYFMDGAPITIGDYAFIGPKCGFYTATHPENIKKRNGGLERALPIVIGDNVWLGANVTVLPGVTIGSGCVIGAGSVVANDIPANSVAVGNPCRVIRQVDPTR